MYYKVCVLYTSYALGFEYSEVTLISHQNKNTLSNTIIIKKVELLVG
ncbi:hypothetical protein COO91_05333 [Nostoc flagelliforme CCNUN1]|uniref:Uncharacterized protein n=1 Tax=Nostoc flagelliforme CCNUN1 TaxID=2038116 RepID=A0A2K8SV41_9NOSO|nr:hypothetical protein COO91_05333 [Nostoc flagelliforme CCNUN1]